tara:strand:+ start:218 stop:502 length:285 start_codon:yes stop_codon:yes gene_type:complete
MEKIENTNWEKLNEDREGMDLQLNMTFKGVDGYVIFSSSFAGQIFSLDAYNRPQSDSWEMKDNEDLVESIVEEFNKYMSPTNPLTVEEFNGKCY